MSQILTTAPRLHPLVAAAAVSVIAVCAAGVGVMTGVLPGSHAGTSPSALTTPAAPPALSTAQATAPVAAPIAAAPPQVSAEPTAPAAPPKAAARPRPVKVAAAHHSVEDAAPARTAAPLPVGNTVPPRVDPYESSTQGMPPSGYGTAQANIPPPPTLPAPVVKPVCANCGVVEAVVETTRPGDASGVGIAGGALGGAVVGKQFGSGRGRDFLTVLGAVGGAIAGNQIEKSVRSTKAYEVRIRMEDGSLRTLNQSTAPAWRNGDHVRVDGGNITLNQS